MYEGQIFCLLGHNGAGKTTTISMLTGMITPSSGDASVAGDSIVSNMSAVRQHLSVCPQHDVLYPNLTVSDHLEVFGHLKGLEGPQLDAAITTAIARVGLTEKRDVKTTASDFNLSTSAMNRFLLMDKRVAEAVQLIRAQHGKRPLR